MKRINGAVILFLTSIVGCTSKYPLPVYTPVVVADTDALTDQNTPKYNSDVSTTLIAVDNKEAAFTAFKTYANEYLNKSDLIRQDIYRNSDIGFLGGVGTLVAGLSGSPEGAAAGALVTSSSSIPTERFSLLVQAANYEKASDTMHCMYRALAVETDKPNYLPDVAVLNDFAYQVHRQLRKAQNSVSLVDVDLDKVKKAIETETKSAQIVEGANQKLIEAQKPLALYKPASVIPQNETEEARNKREQAEADAAKVAKEAAENAAKSELQKTKIADYTAKLDLCLAQF